MQAYSPRQKSCSVDHGDQSDSDVYDQLTNPIFSEQHPHEYSALGFYAVSLTCEDSFGTSSDTSVAVGAEYGIRYHNVVKGVDFVIPVAGGDDSVGSVVVHVDGATISDGVRINSTHVIISRTLLATTGEHKVILKSAGGITIATKVVNVEAAISGVLLSSVNHAAQLNQSVEFQVSVLEGDNLFVNLSYGDGNFELLYVQSSPLTLSRPHMTLIRDLDNNRYLLLTLVV